MINLPVVEHVSRLVIELASRTKAEYDAEEDVARDEAEEGAPLTPESSGSSSTGSSRGRRPSRLYRVGQGKRKRWRGSLREIRPSQIQIQPSQGSRVDFSLSGSKADPFDAFDLPQDSTTDLALHHWASVFQNTRMPINPRQAWMKINLSDKTLLSATTYCSTAHFYFIRGMRTPQNCLHQKVNAIQNINKSLQKAPSDYTMVAVAVMTLLECLSGEPNAVIVHRKGLQLMVFSRGGLENLGFDGACQRTVSWADTCCAILLRIQPSLDPLLITNAGEKAIPGFTVGDLRERLLPLTESTDLSKSIIYIWLRLRYLTEFLASIATKPNVIDDCYFSDKIDFIERQALTLLYSESLVESNAVAFLTAFINASFIYIYEELRECPKWNNVSLCLSQRIHSGLQMVDFGEIGRHCPDLLLWVLLLGRSGTSPLGGAGNLWYLKILDEMEDELGVDVPNAVAGLNYFTVAEAARAGRRKGSRSGDEAG